jgi:hypothetical protein
MAHPEMLVRSPPVKLLLLLLLLLQVMWVLLACLTPHRYRLFEAHQDQQCLAPHHRPGTHLKTRVLAQNR